MKYVSSKFWLFVALSVSLVYYSVATAANPHLEILGEGEYAIYSREDITSPLVSRRIDSGIGYIYYCDSKAAAALRGEFGSIDGESITLNGAFKPQVILRQLGYSQVDSGGGIYYGYSPRGLAFIKNGRQKINLQVAIRDDVTTVGWPVILGAY